MRKVHLAVRRGRGEAQNASRGGAADIAPPKRSSPYFADLRQVVREARG